MATRNPTVKDARPGTVQVSVHDGASGAVIVNAAIGLFRCAAADCNNFDPAKWQPRRDDLVDIRYTDLRGYAVFGGLAPGAYVASYDNVPLTAPQCAELHAGCAALLCFEPQVEPAVTLSFETPDCQPSACRTARVNDRAIAKVSFFGDQSPELRQRVRVAAPPSWSVQRDDPYTFMYAVKRPGTHRFEGQIMLARRQDSGLGALLPDAGIEGGPAALLGVGADFDADERTPNLIGGNVGVSLSRTETEPTEDLSLWTLIRNSTEAMSFSNYLHFIDSLFCGDGANVRGFEAERFSKKAEQFRQLNKRRALPFTDAEAYRVLKAATEAFVMVNCGVLNQPLAFNPSEDDAYLDRRDIPANNDLETVLLSNYLESVDGTVTLPYLAIIRRKLPDIPITLARGSEDDADLCFGIIQDKLSNPCLLELIWSYWHEEGMLVQSMNAITQRFQNVRAPGISEALANSEIDMLRPLNNLIWGYTQDEQHRLTVVRRNYEYDHHYGVRLDGKAVQNFRPADSRSKFLEAFHHLLRLCTSFYRQDDDTTVKADAFPVLNALKEVHLILSQGAHNQFGDLPSTARIEMMMQQWLLARPEFREFLPTRLMVAYPEPWMDRVDAMKKLQNWTDTSVVHFRSLATFGEQILLSVRYGAWSDIYEPTPAFNWARFWRPQVQGYIHAYRAATGVDLSIDAVDPVAEATIPSVLLRQRLSEQLRGS
ncbi:8-amino-7-oxononanoate synthase [Oxalobacteraceae bacterium]|nr:8-amino-7-oxononanoate synthase [Oxalobacteraceae bacterium]